jgi:aspartate/methionine/tyrosine aminotransferase
MAAEPLAQRLAVASRANVPPFHVMDLLAAADARRRSHGDLVNLVAGQPSTPAPRPVREAAHRALDTELLGYTVTTGIAELREAICGHHARTHGIDVTPDQVVVTTGSSGGFLLAFLSAFEAGDRVAIARPGYPCYRNVLAALGCEVVELPAGPESRFQPTVAMLEELDRPVQGLVVASPANPTGTMLAPEELAALARWCEAHGVQLISDEIYHGITDNTVAASCAWDHDREAIVISSFSKYWGMTGWRLGWSLVPADLVSAFDALAGNFALCPPVPAQHAAVAAFTEESYREADAAVAAFADARAIVLDAIDDLGWSGVAPADGAFYVYAGIGGQLGPHLDSESWCEALLEEHGVALTPGTDFDQREGGAAVRVSLAAGPEAVAAALIRILRFQRSLKS